MTKLSSRCLVNCFIMSATFSYISISAASCTADSSKPTIESAVSASSQTPTASESSLNTAASARASAAAVGAACAVSANGGGAKPFDRELFRSFLFAASRLFCDDEQVIILDFLAHQEKAFTERELLERLGWPDKRVREACAALERMMLVIKEQILMGNAASNNGAGRRAEISRNIDNSHSSALNVFSGGGQQGGSASPSRAGIPQTSTSASPFYYRVSPYCFLAFHYRLQRLDQQLETRRQEAENRDVFFCPTCGVEYDALEAQLLDIHPVDAHFLCKYCQEKLEPEDSKIVLQQAISLQERCEKQLKVLRTLVRRGWNMKIPTFLPSTRADRNLQRSKGSEEERNSRRAAGCAESNAGSSISALGLEEDRASFKLNLRQIHGLNGVHSGARPRPSPAWIQGSATAESVITNPLSSHLPPVSAASSSSRGVREAASDAAALAKDQQFKQMQQRQRTEEAIRAAAYLEPQQQTATSSGGLGRNQIKFAMKSSGAGRKSGSVLGSRLRSTALSAPRTQHVSAVATGANNNTAGAPVVAAGTAKSAAPVAAKGAGSAAPVVPIAVSAAGVSRWTAEPTDRALQQPQQRRNVVSGSGDQTPAAVIEGAGDGGVQAEAGFEDVEGGPPLFFVSKIGKEMTLEEAADYQQEMTPEEHEKFLELQAVYLDDI